MRPPLSRRHPGFTLVELMIVVAIIAVLIGLLVPAVQKVRDSADKMACTNNLHNLGLALHGYHHTHKGFPPARIRVGTYKGASWATAILSYLDQDTLHKAYRFDLDARDPLNRPVVSTALTIHRCPAAPLRDLDVFTDGGFDVLTAPGDYVTFMRVESALALLGYVDTLPTLDHYNGVMQTNQALKVQEISDGASNTLLVFESAGRPELWRVGKLVGVPPAFRVRGGGWGDNDNPFSLQGSTFDGVFNPGPCGMNCTNDREMYSFHNGGINGCFADGSVRFIGNGIGIRNLARLITARGGEVVSYDF